ncbi:unnamed protein product, partial [Mesorhabditis belari]|uniref:RING-type domain-containing protein n=1 Tax=Mesorhabditis belari TaxID=2138241 RepID=A0AAF3EGQ0_9BILA
MADARRSGVPPVWCVIMRKMNCSENPTPAYYLSEILSSDSLEMDPSGRGYVLVNEIEVPKCRSCHEKYTLTNKDLWPFVLFCGHTLCRGCLWRVMAPIGADVEEERVLCPVCGEASDYNAIEGSPNYSACLDLTNGLEGFLKELAKQTMWEEESLKICSSYAPPEFFRSSPLPWLPQPPLTLPISFPTPSHDEAKVPK